MTTFSTRTMIAADWAALKHFQASEFTEPDRMGSSFMLWLDALRESAGVPIHITSSYRSPAYNASVGGAKDSAHTDTICNAVDIGKTPTPNDPHWNFARWQIIAAAMKAGCTRIGLYANGSLHLDRTEDVRPAPRLWTVVDNPA